MVEWNGGMEWNTGMTFYLTFGGCYGSRISGMAERKVDWGMQASYCRLQAKIGTCIIVDLQLKGQRVITG